MAIYENASTITVLSCDEPNTFQVWTTSTDVTTEIQAELFYRRNIDEFYTSAGKMKQKKTVGKHYFEFNVQNLLKNILTYDLLTGVTKLITNCENSAISYYLKFTEYYPSSAQVAHDTAVSEIYKCLNTEFFPYELHSLWQDSDWYMDGIASHKFLTDAPTTTYLRSGERIQLGFISYYSDPVIKLKEYKDDTSTSTTTYELPDTTYTHYLWDWDIDESEVCTIVASAAPQPYIDTANSDEVMKYMYDAAQQVWGGVQLTGIYHKLEIYLPVVLTATIANVNFHIKAETSDCDFELYAYYSGSYNLLGATPRVALTSGWTTFTETLPVGSTRVKVVKLESGNLLDVAWATVTWVEDNVINNRCQFVLNTNHVDADTDKLEVWVEQTTAGNIISEVRTFKVDKEKYYNNTTRFAVLNKRGEFDHFTYTRKHNSMLTTEKARVDKERPNTFSNADRGIETVRVVSEEIFTCYSKPLEDNELKWWATIIESPTVFVMENDSAKAIDIISDRLVYYEDTQLVQIKIDWRYSIKR